jgi:hypothetical protein
VSRKLRSLRNIFWDFYEKKNKLFIKIYDFHKSQNFNLLFLTSKNSRKIPQTTWKIFHSPEIFTSIFSLIFDTSHTIEFFNFTFHKAHWWEWRKIFLPKRYLPSITRQTQMRVPRWAKVKINSGSCYHNYRAEEMNGVQIQLGGENKFHLRGKKLWRKKSRD